MGASATAVSDKAKSNAAAAKAAADINAPAFAAAWNGVDAPSSQTEAEIMASQVIRVWGPLSRTLKGINSSILPDDMTVGQIREIVAGVPNGGLGRCHQFTMPSGIDDDLSGRSFGQIVQQVMGTRLKATSLKKFAAKWLPTG